VLYPLLDGENLAGVITRDRLQRAVADFAEQSLRLRDLAKHDPVVAESGELLRAVVHRMAETG
jgi:hypothetical protein